MKRHQAYSPVQDTNLGVKSTKSQKASEASRHNETQGLVVLVQEAAELIRSRGEAAFADFRISGSRCCMQALYDQVCYNYSTIEGVDLKWLRVLLHSIAIVFIVNAISELTRNYFNLIPTDISIYIGLCFIMLGIAYMGFHGLRQTKIFTNDESVVQAVKSQKSNLEDISLQANNNISEEIFNEDYEKLVHFMKNNKPFQDMNLNIVILANQIGFKTRYLCQLINQKSGKNFFDFINSFIISEFKKRIRKPENRNYTLLSIAYDCGFNSKAIFNRVSKIKPDIHLLSILTTQI